MCVAGVNLVRSTSEDNSTLVAATGLPVETVVNLPQSVPGTVCSIAAATKYEISKLSPEFA